MKVNLIHNPVAGNSAQPDAAALKQLIVEAGHEVTVQSSAGLDWAMALEVPCDLIAVAGGDGTAGRIAKRLVGRGIPVTFLPMGTANNISKTFGLSDLSLKQLIAGWQARRSRWIDVGILDAPWGSSYFIEGVGTGLFVRTMMEIDARNALGHLERSEEKIVHALHILSERLAAFPVRRLNLRLDDKELSGEYLMLEVMNIRFVGPNLYIAPTSDPSDGLLDVVLVTEDERADLQQYLANWRRGILGSPILPTHRVKTLRIEDHDGVLHIDDEACPGAEVGPQLSPLDIRAQKHALEVLVPPEPFDDQ